MKGVRLRTKILVLMIGVLTLSGVSMIVLGKTVFYQKLSVRLQQRGISLAGQIAWKSVNPILTERPHELAETVRDFKNSEDDVEYIFILDGRGAVIAHTFEKGFPVRLKNVNELVAGQTHNVRPFRIDEKNIEKNILDIAVPVLGGEEGVVHVGISRDPIIEDVNEIVMVMVWMITGVMIVGGIAAFVLARRITKPVSELTGAVKIAGSGDLNHMVRVSAHDEIGLLAESFNKMTGDLKKREAEMEMINSELTALQIISAIATDSHNLKDLFTDVLAAVTNFGILRFARKGAVFMIKGDRMDLVLQTGFTEAFEKAHKGMKVGQCICGLAAETGKIVVSENSESDSRHTITYPGITPHGHVSIPLAARNRIFGVLCLYPPVGTEIDERKTALFYTIGSRIGAAIDNILLYEEIKELSLHDPLTNLANRRLMNYVLETSYARARRAEGPLSAIMLDIDFFKQYNDTYGHTVGDNMLVSIANIISKEIRQIDLGVRYGGEEFLILLPETGLSEACEVAERIRRDVETNTGITVSLGVSCYDHSMSRKEDIVSKADDALLRAKQKGRNRIEVNA
ncbi:MAG: diguanylate cyclase [Nitrospiraceae bacterium]|nr:MAG: diguanylate cyclase [Nitrospiraceae bacterium]